MKRMFIATLLILAAAALGGYYLYRSLMPTIVARAVTADSLPGYIPKRLHTRVDAIRKPMNQGTAAMIETMHEANIPLEKVLDAIDGISEEQAYDFLDEFNVTNPSTADEVFDLAKKHFPTAFNPEVFREPFKKHFQMKQIRNAIAYANLNRKSNDVDISTAKAILKKIIIEKEKEVGAPAN